MVRISTLNLQSRVLIIYLLKPSKSNRNVFSTIKGQAKWSFNLPNLLKAKRSKIKNVSMSK